MRRAGRRIDVVRSVVFVAMLVLFAPRAEAQLPPWAARPVEPTPAFLVVPPPPEREEPPEVRAMRDAYATALSANQSLRVALRAHDAQMAAVREIGDGRLDPSEALARDAAWAEMVQAAAAWIGRPHRALFVDDLVRDDSHTADARLAVALLALGMLHDEEDVVDEEEDGHAVSSLTFRVMRRWVCSRHESVPLAYAGDCATTAEARRARPSPWCHGQVWWRAPGSLDAVGGLECAEPVAPSASCADLLERALTRHEQGRQLRNGGVLERDEELERRARERYTDAAETYRVYLARCPQLDDLSATYTLTYNLADALFWSESYEEAAREYERVRDWSWREGRLADGAQYTDDAARRVVEARQRLLDATVARGEIVLPAIASSPTPQPVPELCGRLILAREIYIARAEADLEHVRPVYLLSNAETLERYGYWDEARARYAAVLAAGPADLATRARDAIVRMATALGDTAEVARVTTSPR